jgi:hypothetical protein
MKKITIQSMREKEYIAHIQGVAIVFKHGVAVVEDEIAKMIADIKNPLYLIQDIEAKKSAPKKSAPAKKEEPKSKPKPESKPEEKAVEEKPKKE